MDKEIKPVAVDAITTTPASSNNPLTFTQTGDNGTQIGHVDTVNAYTTVEMVAPVMQPDGTIARRRA